MRANESTPVRDYIREYFVLLGASTARLPHIVFLMLVSAALDLIGLGLIVPLVMALGGVASAGGTQMFPQWFPASMLAQPTTVTALCLGLVAVFAAKAIATVRVHKGIVRFSDRHRGKLMHRLMANYLAQPYEFHIQRNSAELVQHLLNTTFQYSSGTLGASLRLVTDVLTFVVIAAFISYAHWQTVLLMLLPIVAAMVVFIRVTRAKVLEAGRAVTWSSTAVVRTVNHGIGALREIRLLGIESNVLDELRDQARALAEATSSHSALAVVPRVVVETTVIVVLAVLVLVSAWGWIAGESLIVILGVMAFAAMRLMPGVTSIVNSVNNIIHTRDALHRLYHDLLPTRGAGGGRTTLAGERQLFAAFREIKVDRVWYRYPGSERFALNECTFEVRAGQAVGLIGPSGAGKSTAVDVLLGLLAPQSGFVRVDGMDVRRDLRAWMDCLAYIPQTVFLTDDSLLHNVAFGQDATSVDHSRLEFALRASRLDEVVRALPQGVYSNVGERGVRLSGGERQRVALARALYYDRRLIVMDEATSALDSETERDVIAAIRHLHGTKTLVIIAHSVSTLEACDVIYCLQDGRIVRRASYRELLQAKEVEVPLMGGSS